MTFFLCKKHSVHLTLWYMYLFAYRVGKWYPFTGSHSRHMWIRMLMPGVSWRTQKDGLVIGSPMTDVTKCEQALSLSLEFYDISGILSPMWWLRFKSAVFLSMQQGDRHQLGCAGDMVSAFTRENDCIALISLQIPWLTQTKESCDCHWRHCISRLDFLTLLNTVVPHSSLAQGYLSTKM